MSPNAIPAFLSLTLFVFSPLAAQSVDPPSAPIDEIIVTADYRGRAVADLPASVTVLDAATISGAAVQHFEELIGMLPNLNWSGDGHRARYLQIRGVGELAQYQGAPNPSVGFLIDDIDFSGIGTIATLFDVDRIEVLRGPQGTRYGSNALAGLIYMRSADPGDSFDGRISVTKGEDDATGAGVAFGGPIGDSAGYRVSAHHFQSNGFRSNPFLGRDDTNARDETTIRAKWLWDATDDLSLKLTAMLSDIDDGYDAFAIDNSLQVLSDKPGRDAQRSLGASFVANWSGSSAFRLTSVTSIADSDIDFSFDADWGNEAAWAPVTYDYVSLSDRQRRTLNQELRLTSREDGRLFGGTTNWLAGVYLNRMDEDLATLNQGEYFDPASGFADTLDDRLGSSFDAMNSALFGQLGVAVGEAGTLTIGARIEHRGVDYVDTSGLAVAPSETMAGGEIAYTHDLSERTTGFVTLSRGYKAGGFNLGFVPAGRREFGEESMWSAEAGVKSSFDRDRLTLFASAFYSRRLDQQVETSFQLNPNDPASFVFFTDNAAKGSTVGLEAEVLWLPTEALELYANFGLLDAKFDDFVTPQVDASGRDQAHAPAYTAAVGAVYHHASGWFARLDATARDAFYFDVSHDEVSESYSLVNARIGFENERFTAQLWLKNAFDERYAVRGFFFGNEPPDFPPALYIRQGDPRQLGVTLDMRF